MAIADASADFEDLFRNEYQHVVRALFLLTRDRNEAEELAQEAFARVYGRWKKADSIQNPSGYVYTIAVNLWRRSRRWSLQTLLERASDSRIDTNIDSGLDERIDILRAMSRLTQRQQAILVMTYWLGLSSEEVGRALRLSPAAVRAQSHRARDVLRTLLEGAG